METLRKHISELEAKAAEASLIADLATDPKARVTYTRLAKELAEAIEGLRLGAPDQEFLMLQAAKCRAMADETTDAVMRADLQKLAADFETKARQLK